MSQFSFPDSLHRDYENIKAFFGLQEPPNCHPSPPSSTSSWESAFGSPDLALTPSTPVSSPDSLAPNCSLVDADPTLLSAPITLQTNPLTAATSATINLRPTPSINHRGQKGSACHSGKFSHSRPLTSRSTQGRIQEDLYCEICDVGFHNVRSKKRHLATTKIHRTNKTVLFTPICGKKSYTREDSYKRHLSACQYCPTGQLYPGAKKTRRRKTTGSKTRTPSGEVSPAPSQFHKLSSRIPGIAEPSILHSSHPIYQGNHASAGSSHPASNLTIIETQSSGAIPGARELSHSLFNNPVHTASSNPSDFCYVQEPSSSYSAQIHCLAGDQTLGWHSLESFLGHNPQVNYGTSSFKDLFDPSVFPPLPTVRPLDSANEFDPEFMKFLEEQGMLAPVP